MTTKEFLKQYNNVPYSLEEVVGLVSEIIDNKDLVDAADAFLEIQEEFRMELFAIGFEFG